MKTTVTYNSKFLKADARENESNDECIVYTTQYDRSFIVKDIHVAASILHIIEHTGQCQNMILPIIGDLKITEATGKEWTLRPGQLYFFKNNISIRNPHTGQPVNFLQIGLENGEMTNGIFPLNIARKNQLVAGEEVAAHIRVGVYDSRTKDIASLKENNGAILAYVLNGSFELENRLLEHRDALYLWDISEVDFESLSEIAVLLLIDCSSIKTKQTCKDRTS
ncbi:MAG: hypothetical protein ACTHKV_09835 [Flavipsychrobacter sp.]